MTCLGEKAKELMDQQLVENWKQKYRTYICCQAGQTYYKKATTQKAALNYFRRMLYTKFGRFAPTEFKEVTVCVPQIKKKTALKSAVKLICWLWVFCA